MGGRGSWSQTYKNEMVIGGAGVNFGDSKKDLNARFNPGGRFVNSGTTARHAEAIISQNDYETGIIIEAKTGDVLAAYKGGRDSVGFADNTAGTDNYGNLKGNVMTHNHPSGLAVFSAADLRVSAHYGVKEVRVTTKRNGTAILTANNQHSDMAGLAKAYDRATTGKMTAKQAQDWLRKNASSYGITFRLE